MRRSGKSLPCHSRPGNSRLLDPQIPEKRWRSLDEDPQLGALDRPGRGRSRPLARWEAGWGPAPDLTPEEAQTLQTRVFRLASRLPSTEHGSDNEPLSLLGAVREALGADRRCKGMLPAAPRVRIVGAPADRDRLPILPAQQRQLTLPSMPATDRDVIAPAAWLQVFDRLGGN